jgi:hypothetical protein
MVKNTGRHYKKDMKYTSSLGFFLAITGKNTQ